MPGSAERCEATRNPRERRREPQRDERRGAGDEAVEHDDERRRGGPERDAHEDADLEAADGGQHAERIGRVGRVALEHARDDRSLAGDSVGVEAGARAAQLGRVAPQERCGERGRGGRVPDPHLPDADCRVPASASSKASAAPATIDATA